MKKKILAFLLACTLAVGMAVSPVGTETVWADNGEGTYNGFGYFEYKDYIEIYRYTGTATTVVIPEKINEKPVTQIGSSTFENCSNMTSVEIPSTVTKIGSYSFRGCSSLASIKLPSNLKEIGGWAFYGCSSLTSITIPSSVTKIDSSQNPFANCSQLKKILLEEGNSVYETENDILYKKSGELISCPAGIAATRIDIREGVTEICTDAFNGCSKLTSITIPSSVTTINGSAFDGCSGLTSIVIPSSVYQISNGAFSNCSSLTSITIPSRVKIRNGNPFMGCSRLKEILVEGNDSECISRDGILCSSDGTLIAYPEGKGTEQVSFPKEVTSIGDYAFARNNKLTSITIPSNITTIGWYAFWSCNGLTSVKISEGVTNIGMRAFQDCNSLASVIIPLSITRMDVNVFSQAISVGSEHSLKDVYYAGSKEQFDKLIQIVDKSFWDSMNIHYNSTGPADAGSGGSTTPTDTTGKTNQTITAKNITKTYGAKAFNLNAKSSAGAALTYTVKDKKVATIDTKGKVTIKGCGITNITITAKGTEKYNKATKTIKLTVKPKKATLSSVKSAKKKSATVKWKQDKKASGYIIQFATDSKFKKNKVQVNINKNKTVSKTVTKLKPGKKYYVRVRAYAKSGKTNVQGDWSKVKTVNVKK